MLKIYTIGDFDIFDGDSSLLESNGYPHRTLKLFKYFLTYKDRKILPENIIEDLWYDSDFMEPKNVLRTQISRLRRMFTDKLGQEQFFTIESISGYYVFRMKDEIFLDIEEFERLINQGISLSDRNPEQGMVMLREAIDLYKGEYLGELEDDDWIIPVRNKVKRLYLKGLYTYMELLKKSNRNKEIVEVCEKTMEHDPYGEVLHIYFIEALLKIGEKRYALSHYEYITSRMYNNLGIAPSNKMRELYRSLQSYDENIQRPIDIKGLEQELEDEEEEYGALICEPFYFKFLYNLEKRKRVEEENKDVFLALMTLQDRANHRTKESGNIANMDMLVEFLGENLRRSDVLTKWNDNQIVSLLYGVKEKDLDIIVNRLEEKLKIRTTPNFMELSIKFKSL